MLDQRRLSRQIVECNSVAVLLHTYQKIGKVPWGVQFHPVINLWISDGRVLIAELWEYQKVLSKEWKRLNGRDHKASYSLNWRGLFDSYTPIKLAWPEEVYESHKAKLLEKDSAYYYSALVRNGLSIPDNITEYSWSNPYEDIR